MRELLGLLVVIAIIAIIWYLRKQNAQAAEQRKVDEFRRLQAAAAAADQAEQTERASLAPAAAPARGDASGTVERGRGFMRTVTDTVSGEEYERAVGEMEAMTADLERAIQDADREAQRLTNRADEAIASIQAAAAAHGGAVPGNGAHDCPPNYPVKGNMPSMRYHLPGQPSYGRTIPEVCFQNAEAAMAAGFAESGDETGRRSDVIVDGIAAEAIAASEAGGVPPGAVRGDGSRDCPPAYPIKASQTAMRFLAPDAPAYDATIPELCFSSVESAQGAGLSATRQ
jgi:hypothetical protein